MPDSDTSPEKPQHSVKLPYLYKEGSKILKAYAEKRGTLKSLVYATRQDRLFKRLLALVCRAVDNQPVIDAALASAGLLSAEPGLAPSTARLLTAELLFGTGKLDSQARPALTVLRYADQLRTAAAAAAAAADGAGAAADRRPALPRYVRVNTLLASVYDVIKQLTAEGWERVKYPPDVTYEQFIAQVKSLSKGQFLLDLHVPCLLVFPPGTELHQHPLYRGGQLILQDKASCLPPVVLAPSPGEHVIDACSAPGMKTSQLAAMMNNKGTLVAVERDEGRFQTLSKMLKRAGATNTRLLNGDFMKLKPQDYPRVTAILLDPSCSGTGMVSREPEDPPTEERLRRLANLQGMLLRHALGFPAVRRVVYSTCSITEDENEQVVAATLAAHPGWRLAAAAPATWRGRGRTTLADGERCIRADPSADLCHGFFVAAFEKVDHAAVGGHKKKKEKRKRSGERQDEADAISVEASDDGKKRGSNEAAEVGENDGLQDEEPKKKKKKEKRKRSEISESGEPKVEALQRSSDEKRQSSNATTDAEKSDGVPDGEPRKKKKKGKQKQSETLESGEPGVQTLETNGDEKGQYSIVTTGAEKSDGIPDEEPREKKKKKENRSGTVERSEAVSVDENGGKEGRGLSVTSPAEVQKSNDVQDEVPRQKKKKRQNGATESGTTRGGPIEMNSRKENIGQSLALEPEVSSYDVPAGVTEKKTKKKRGRSGDDEKEEADAAPAKRGKSEEACVDPPEDHPNKQHKKSGRLSKRRRYMLKWKKSAAFIAR